MLIMRNRLKGIVTKGFIVYCMIYTASTIISSIWQLAMGSEEDTNIHLIHRAVVILIAVIVMELCINIKLKNPILTWLAIYVPSMLIVLLYVWIIGFFETLSKYAYRDIFLNYTSVAVIVGIIMFMIDLIKTKRTKEKYENK